MKSWTVSNGYSIYRVNDIRSNVFLISAPNGNILVDTGMEFTFRNMMRNIHSLGLASSHIDFLILTHTHFDHCRNARLLKDGEKCRIIASSLEADEAARGYTEIPGGTYKITDFIAGLGKQIGGSFFGYEAFQTDILVDDFLNLDTYGYDIKIISTPGHSKGSISVVVNNEISIAGDAIYRLYKNVIMPPFADDKNEMIKSWGKLLESGCRLFLPGHGDEISRFFLETEYRRQSSSTEP
jgi:glyoxylase-like metal-dependent hydrolase (beta-lactamase superfamily II)